MKIENYVLPAGVQLECKKVAGFFQSNKQRNPPVATVKITDIDLALMPHTAPSMKFHVHSSGALAYCDVVDVPLIWLRTQPTLVSDIYETELSYWRRTHVGSKAQYIAGLQVLQTTVDRLRCVSAAFPEHGSLKELCNEGQRHT